MTELLPLTRKEALAFVPLLAGLGKAIAGSALLEGGMHLGGKLLGKMKKPPAVASRMYNPFTAAHMPGAANTSSLSPLSSYIPKDAYNSVNPGRRLAFEVGVESFCKDAGYDADDYKDLLLLIRKEAVDRIDSGGQTAYASGDSSFSPFARASRDAALRGQMAAPMNATPGAKPGGAATAANPEKAEGWGNLYTTSVAEKPRSIAERATDPKNFWESVQRTTGRTLGTGRDWAGSVGDLVGARTGAENIFDSVLGVPRALGVALGGGKVTEGVGALDWSKQFRRGYGEPRAARAMEKQRADQALSVEKYMENATPEQQQAFMKTRGKAFGAFGAERGALNRAKLQAATAPDVFRNAAEQDPDPEGQARRSAADNPNWTREEARTALGVPAPGVSPSPSSSQPNALQPPMAGVPGRPAQSVAVNQGIPPPIPWTKPGVGGRPALPELQ